ncbi:hypothetical protein [Isoptericola croceus]|uniref:hypothetical protein n=1 Tax=Isoptericola croceus TaxID=3031406 RepID=UPI0023F6BC10|nr:hypothetical protein [Isoptericola croceus]
MSTPTLPSMADRFAADVAEHELTVLHDDGLYRHIRLAKPGTGVRGFQLVTWPGYLAYTGDMGAYTFAREADMFAWFGTGRPNLGYWGEKVTAVDRHAAVVEYDEGHAVSRLREYLTEEPEWAGRSRETWHRLVSTFATNEDLHDETTFRQALDEFDVEHDAGLTDTGEWDLTCWSFRFEWACHAIPWAIARYRDHVGHLEAAA